MSSFAGVLADGELVYHKSDIALLVCESVIEKVALFFEETDAVGFCNVDNQQALGTMAHCLKRIPQREGVKAFLRSLVIIWINRRRSLPGLFECDQIFN